MRTIPSALQAKLDAGVTTLCWCWRITRADGAVLGFTDHDRDLAFDGVTYRRGTAASAGDVESEAGFAAGSAAAAGRLASDALEAADIRKGLYDEALADLYRVDWTDVSLRVTVWSGRIGEIRYGEIGFEAELRGRTAALERTIGRVFQRRCDAELGDARCGVDATASAYRGTGTVASAASGRAFTASGLSAFADGWFTGGVLRWTGGANAGAVSAVEAHGLAGADATVTLAIAPSETIAIGDVFTVDAGCDKRWATCQAKFANTINFRGFPMIPGDDWLQAGPRAGARNAGGSLWTDREA